MDLFIIGFKNVFRNKRRSMLNVVALALGTTIMIVFLGWIRGYFTGFYDSIIKFETGNVQILDKGYLAEERRLPLDLVVSGYRSFGEQVRAQKGVEEAAGRIDFSVKVGNGVDSIFMLGRAIDPTREANVTVLPKYVASGEYLDKGPGILIGKSIAAKLSLKTGDTAYLTAYDRHSVQNFTDVKVRGIFNFGYPAMDDNIVFTDLGTADSLLGMNDEVTRVVLRLAPGHSPESAVKRLDGETILPANIEAYPWQKFAEVAVSAVQADSGSAWIMAVIIYIFIIIGILNSMSMSVFERTQEVGTLRAVGMRKSALISMFLYESIGISLISCAIGFMVAGALGLYLQFVGFDFGSFMPKDIPIPFGEKFTADFRWHDFLIGGLSGIVSAVAGGVIPAIRSSKIVIAHALGSTAVR